MREQRKSQTQWLRQHQQEAEQILQQLLRGVPVTGGWNEALSKEVLLAFHFWMLDFAADGLEPVKTHLPSNARTSETNAHL